MTGHRITENWMGESIESLADLFPNPLRVVCVGINPSRVSVEAGHYYQGRLGQAFFRRLKTANLLPNSFDGFEDDAAAKLGIGFTDIVKRPTPRANEIRAEEYTYGRNLLELKMKRFRPQAIVFTFKATAEILLGKFRGCGWLDRQLFGTSDVFVMPGPYAPRDEVTHHLESLRAKLGR